MSKSSSLLRGELDRLDDKHEYKYTILVHYLHAGFILQCRSESIFFIAVLRLTIFA